MLLEKLHLKAVPFARPSDHACVLSESTERAEKYLARTLASRQPLAVVTDPCGSMSSLVVHRFLAQLDEAVTVIRSPRENRSDVLAAMQRIIRGIGFDPAELNLADMENVLLLFLQHRRAKQLRTIISFEDVGEDESWLLHYLGRLLNLEAEHEFGLLIVVAGEPAVGQQLQFTMMHGERIRTSEHLDLSPLRETETLELLRSEIEACGAPEIGRVIEFAAVKRIHELTGGVPDTIGTLCQRVLELAGDRGCVPASVALVDECAQAMSLIEPSDPLTDTAAHGWLVIQDGSAAPRTVPLIRDRAVIGRGTCCDVQIADHWATREHALLLRTKRGLLVIDLLSTNGTFVNSQPIIRHCLKDHETICIGTSQLTYRSQRPEKIASDQDVPIAEEFEIPVLSQAVG